jgi:LEA14-like dessication related protein
MKHKTVLVIFISLMICCGAQAQTASKKPEVEFKGISIKRVDLSKQTADANLTVEVKNPGPALRIKDAEYKIRINDKQLAEGKYDKEINLPASSTSTLEVPVTVNLMALPGVTWNFLWDGMTLHYDADTEFVVSVFAFNSGKIKTTFTGKQPLSGLLSSIYEKVREQLK